MGKREKKALARLRRGKEESNSPTKFFLLSPCPMACWGKRDDEAWSIPPSLFCKKRRIDCRLFMHARNHLPRASPDRICQCASIGVKQTNACSSIHPSIRCIASRAKRVIHCHTIFSFLSQARLCVMSCNRPSHVFCVVFPPSFPHPYINPRSQSSTLFASFACHTPLCHSLRTRIVSLSYDLLPSIVSFYHGRS
jgi:hypothetical protein